MFKFFNKNEFEVFCYYGTKKILIGKFQDCKKALLAVECIFMLNADEIYMFNKKDRVMSIFTRDDYKNNLISKPSR